MKLCKQLIDFRCRQLNGIVQAIDFDGWKLIGIVRTTNFRGGPRSKSPEKCHDLVPISCIPIDTPIKSTLLKIKHNAAVPCKSLGVQGTSSSC